MPELEDPIKKPEATMPADAADKANMEGASKKPPEFNATAGGGAGMEDEEPVQS